MIEAGRHDGQVTTNSITARSHRPQHADASDVHASSLLREAFPLAPTESIPVVPGERDTQKIPQTKDKTITRRFTGKKWAAIVTTLAVGLGGIYTGLKAGGESIPGNRPGVTTTHTPNPERSVQTAGQGGPSLEPGKPTTSGSPGGSSAPSESASPSISPSVEGTPTPTEDPTSPTPGPTSTGEIDVPPTTPPAPDPESTS